MSTSNCDFHFDDSFDMKINFFFQENFEQHFWNVCVFLFSLVFNLSTKKHVSTLIAQAYNKSTLTKHLCVMHTLVSSQPIRLIRLYERKRKIYGKNNTVIGKHLQTWTVFFYCLARTWKKKQSIVWYSWLQPLSSLNRAIKRTQSQKKWFSVFIFLSRFSFLC